MEYTTVHESYEINRDPNAKRYTMADIRKIDERISQIEYGRRNLK